jgi:hypothetical protein
MGRTADGRAGAWLWWVEKDLKAKRNDFRNLDMIAVRKLRLGRGQIAASR